MVKTIWEPAQLWDMARRRRVKLQDALHYPRDRDSTERCLQGEGWPLEEEEWMLRWMVQLSR